MPIRRYANLPMERQNVRTFPALRPASSGKVSSTFYPFSLSLSLCLSDPARSGHGGNQPTKPTNHPLCEPPRLKHGVSQTSNPSPTFPTLSTEYGAWPMKNA